ncbi:MAG: hypothetical protein Q4E48_03585 [Prevotella sp.]|nr:hypothetical protein [Prevotella sp.]
MTALFFSSEAGLILGLLLVISLIFLGLKSISRKIVSSNVVETPSIKEINNRLGPMTWQENVASVILIAVIVAVAVGLAMIT